MEGHVSGKSYFMSYPLPHVLTPCRCHRFRNSTAACHRKMVVSAVPSFKLALELVLKPTRFSHICLRKFPGCSGHCRKSVCCLDCWLLSFSQTLSTGTCAAHKPTAQLPPLKAHRPQSLRHPRPIAGMGQFWVAKVGKTLHA